MACTSLTLRDPLYEAVLPVIGGAHELYLSVLDGVYASIFRNLREQTCV